MIVQRFQVTLDECQAWKVIDIDYKKYNMPEKAVSLFFKKPQDAATVCNTLNKEWVSFSNNPS